jgi:hypothetical protein
MRQGAFSPAFLVYLTMLCWLCVRMFVNHNLEGPVRQTTQQNSLIFRAEESKVSEPPSFFRHQPINYFNLYKGQIEIY